VPPPSLPEFRKIQKVLVEELEKKLTGCTVLLIANRTMVQPKVWAHSKQYSGVRPRSRTLKAVQEAMLDDIVFPSEIVGKRVNIRQDQSRTLKCTLSTREQGTTEGKIETFQNIYSPVFGNQPAPPCFAVYPNA
jgi:small subunit ribosomal protein S7e